MRKVLIQLVVIGCICVGTFAAAAPKKNGASTGGSWSKQYDKPSAYSWNYDLRALPDGGFITVGNLADSAASGCWKLLARRTDVFGKMIWEKTFAGECQNAMAGSSGHAVSYTSDGGFIIAGTRNSSNLAAKRNTWEELWVLKLSGSGQLQWEKHFGQQWAVSTKRGNGYGVVEAAGGGYLVSGVGHPDSGDAWVFKLDSAGNKLWERILPGYHSTEEYQRMVPITQLSNGTIVITYPVARKMSTITRITMLRSDGTVKRSMQFGGRETQVFDLLAVKGGGFAVSGTTKPFLNSTNATFSGFLMAFDNEGRWLWDREYPADKETGFSSVRQAADNGLIVSGRIGNDLLVLKTDEQGKPRWAKALGAGKGFQKGYAAVQASDGGFAVAGARQQGQNILAWLVKLDKDGRSVGLPGVRDAMFIGNPLLVSDIWPAKQGCLGSPGDVRSVRSYGNPDLQFTLQRPYRLEQIKTLLAWPPAGSIRFRIMHAETKQILHAGTLVKGNCADQTWCEGSAVISKRAEPGAYIVRYDDSAAVCLANEDAFATRLSGIPLDPVEQL
ncbi:MAG: hypothetical protein OEL57_03360 [Trichlorobacter sp.]|uniref:hypothetical protein n=1 Tax=Trichlorobacter sp. TaxID=2911007 RepID=UPI0025656673|nr:hypothetical protein [Trichlorobacter sp.]MDK9716930.1 hypothetical protein [Trichlorobacter sp.]